MEEQPGEALLLVEAEDQTLVFPSQADWGRDLRTYGDIPVLEELPMSLCMQAPIPAPRKLHDSWIVPLQSLLTLLLREMDTEIERVSRVTTMAFLLIPQLIKMGQIRKKKVIDILVGLIELPNRSNAVINMFIHGCEELAPQPSRRRAAATSPRDLQRRVDNLISAERYHLAAEEVKNYRGVDSPSLSSHESKTLVGQLHPPGVWLEPLEHPPPEAPLHLSPEQVIAATLRLKCASARGCSHWSFRFIRHLLLHGANKERLLAALIPIYVRIINNSLPSSDLWCASRLILLPKEDGSFRPIAIGEAWLRLLNRTLVAQYSTEVGRILSPVQLGVGVSGGCEIISHIAQQYSHPDTPQVTVAAIDVRNAFNTLRHDAIREGIEAFCPSLGPIFEWAYRHPQPLFATDGVPLGQSATGVRQGDPLGPLFFCMGFHKVLTDLQSALGPLTKVLAYMDDITIVGDRANILDKLPRLEVSLQSCGMVPNFNKSAILGPSPGPDDPPSLLTNRPLLRCLGTPISIPEAQREWVQARLAVQHGVLANLALLDAPSGYLLLHWCLNAATGYVSRCIPPEVIQEPLASFDDRVDTALGKILNAETLPTLSRRIRGLPIRLGGIGLQRAAEVAPHAFRSATLLVKTFIGQYLPDLTHQPPGRHRPHGDSNEEEDEEADPSEHANQIREVHKANLADILQELRFIGRFDQAGWLLSQANPNTGRWLTCEPYIRKSIGLTPDLFRTALRTRVLLDLRNCPTVQPVRCRRCEGSQTSMNALHALDCCMNSNATVHRHHAICAAFHHAIKAQLPPLAVIEREVPVTPPPCRLVVADIVYPEDALPPNHNVVADIVYPQDARIMALDVCVVNPAAPTHTSRGSATVVGSAANRAYQEKRKHYEPASQLGVTVVPLIIEATGFCHSSTVNYLAELFRLHQEPNEALKQQRKHLLTLISVICAKFLGIMIRQSSSRLVQAPALH
ncbi:MAG: hypothetical protein JKX76_00200 [Colwellia sp.]|nr:hypothetical protein [Colwellia sp.]